MHPPNKIVTKQETRPCGCHLTEFADKTAQVVPCVACGLAEAANSLGRAAGALGAVANRLRMESGQQAIAEATRAIQGAG